MIRVILRKVSVFLNSVSAHAGFWLIKISYFCPEAKCTNPTESFTLNAIMKRNFSFQRNCRRKYKILWAQYIIFVYSKLGCVVRMAVDSILPQVECEQNGHRKDAPRLGLTLKNWYRQQSPYEMLFHNFSLGPLNLHISGPRRHKFTKLRSFFWNFLLLIWENLLVHASLRGWSLRIALLYGEIYLS